MRVAFVSPGWPPSAFANGIVTYIQLVREALGELGVESSVLAARLEASEQSESAIDLRDCEPRFMRAERLRRRAVAQVKPNEIIPDIVASRILRGVNRFSERHPIDLIEMEESLGTARLVARRGKVPVITRLHGPWFLNGAALGAPRDDKFRKRVAAEGRAIQEAKALTSPSAELLASVRAEYGLELPRAEVIHNPAPVVEEAARWRLSDCDRDVVLFVGRFDRHKGGDLVVDAFAKVAANRPGLRLVFIGPDRGLEEERGGRLSLPDYLAKSVPDVSVRNRIEHLGQRTADEIATWRRKAAVTLVASRFEVVGMVTLEAMAFGSPLVATRVGGIPEVVEHDRNGFLCEPGDSTDLAHWLEVALNDPSRASSLGEQASKDAVVRFGPDAIARKTKSFYERVLGGVKS